MLDLPADQLGEGLERTDPGFFREYILDANDSPAPSSDGDPPLKRPRQAGFIVWPLAFLLVCVVVIGFGTCRESGKGDVPFVHTLSPPFTSKHPRPIVRDRLISDLMQMGEMSLHSALNRAVWIASNRYFEVYRFGAVGVWRDNFSDFPSLLTDSEGSSDRHWKSRRIDQIHPDSHFVVVRPVRTSPIGEFAARS